MYQADNKRSFREPRKLHLLAAYSSTLLLQQYQGTLKTYHDFDGGKQYVTFYAERIIHVVNCPPQTIWLQLQGEYLSGLHRYLCLYSAGQSGGGI